MFSNAENSEFSSNFISHLEPRLIEYIKKKKYYKENGIEDHFLEKEFDIGKNDIEKIKKYFQGKKLKKNSGYTDMISPSSSSFPSDELQKDHRFERVKIKQMRDKEAREQRGNYDMMARDYDMYRDDRKFASAYGNDFKSRFNPQVWFEGSKDNKEWESDEEIENPYELNKKNVVSQNQVTHMRRRNDNPKVYKHTTPNIRYEDRVTWGCNKDLASNNYSLDSIMNNLDTYNNNVKRTPKDHNKNNNKLYKNIIDDNIVMDNGRKIQKNKKENENVYQTDVKISNKKMKDVDVENYLCYGNGPSRGAKSLGYPNPAEHYFQYISNDISKPEHTVFDPGMSSRLYNKDTARPYKGRDILQ